jgi:predicted DNA-binding transcriptional regulator YafY
MRQSDRLLHLLEALRTLPSPATGEQLVSTTGVSIRSVYRDIETLRAGGGEVVTAKKQ